MKGERAVACLGPLSAWNEHVWHCAQECSRRQPPLAHRLAIDFQAGHVCRQTLKEDQSTAVVQFQLHASSNAQVVLLRIKTSTNTFSTPGSCRSQRGCSQHPSPSKGKNATSILRGSCWGAGGGGGMLTSATRAATVS